MVVFKRVRHRQMPHWGILGSVDGKIIPDSENMFLWESFNFPDSRASLGVSFDSFIDNPSHDAPKVHRCEFGGDELNESLLAAVIPEFTHFILEAESLFTTQLLDDIFADFLILLFKAALLENLGDGILT